MKAIVFGIGGLCRAYMKDRYDERLYEIVAFSDNDSEKWGMDFYGKKVIPPAEICGLEYDIIVVISSFYEIIREGLVADYQIKAESIVKMDVLEMWWQEVYNKSYRDQLSLNYCLWKCNFIYDICPFHLYSNHYLENLPHNKK